MKTNFKKLNTFEALTITMIAVGLVIVLASMFNALPQAGQNEFKAAFGILDVEEAFMDEMETISFVFEVSETYLEEFYLAFSQTLTIPDYDVVMVRAAIEKVLVYGESLAMDYQLQSITENEGQVAGAAIDLTHTDCDPARGGLVCRLKNMSIIFN